MRTTEITAELEKLNIKLKLFGLEAQCVHSKWKPTGYTDITGTWRPYPFRLHFLVTGKHGVDWQLKKHNAFGTLEELKFCVNAIISAVQRGVDPRDIAYGTWRPSKVFTK